MAYQFRRIYSANICQFGQSPQNAAVGPHQIVIIYDKFSIASTIRSRTNQQNDDR